MIIISLITLIMSTQFCLKNLFLHTDLRQSATVESIYNLFLKPFYFDFFIKRSLTDK